MIDNYNRNKLENYSLRFLFAAYKIRREPELLAEIYSRTFSHVLQKMLPMLSHKEAASKVQEVYRILALTLTRTEQECDLYCYLNRLVKNSIEVNLVENQLMQA